MTLHVKRYVLIKDCNIVWCEKTSWDRFCARIIRNILTQKIYCKVRNKIAYQEYLKIFFDSLSTNVILIAVTMITHCIQEYKSEEHRLDKFEKLNMKSKWTFAYISD